MSGGAAGTAPAFSLHEMWIESPPELPRRPRRYARAGWSNDTVTLGLLVLVFALMAGVVLFALGALPFFPVTLR